MAYESTPLTVKSGRLVVESESRTTSLSAKKSVTFSVTSQLKFMHYPSSTETNAIWYDKDDSVRFRKVRARDVMNCSRLVIAKIEQDGRLSA